MLTQFDAIERSAVRQRGILATLAGLLLIVSAIYLATAAGRESKPRTDAAERDDVRSPKKDSDIAAPIVYKDLMLVLVNSEGAAAVVFTGDIDVDEVARGELRKGVSYRYRYESRDGKTTLAGDGTLFERRSRGADGEYLGGRLFINAGPIRLGWSCRDAGQGWIYYTPEEMRVHIARARLFEDTVEFPPFGERPHTVPKLDLKRFLKEIATNAPAAAPAAATGAEAD